MAAVMTSPGIGPSGPRRQKTVLTSKWKDEPDVQALIGKTRKAAEEQRREVRLDTDPNRLSPRWARLRQNYLDLGAPALPGQEPSAAGRRGRAR
jgi:hypothetical protein